MLAIAARLGGVAVVEIARKHEAENQEAHHGKRHIPLTCMLMG